MKDTTGDPDLSTLLARASADPATLARLHTTLEDAAYRDGLLDVAYTVVDSPVGRLLLAATERGLVRVAFHNQDHDKVLDTLATTLSPGCCALPSASTTWPANSTSTSCGARKTFDLPLDLSLSHGFRQSVQRHLPEIAYGRTLSYAEVARLVGNPKAVRAVGTACATNPLPVVVPCHRVLRSDGTLGGYAGGPAAKSVLLDLEAAARHTGG